MKTLRRTWKTLLVCMLAIPFMISSALAAVPVPTIYVDMDASTPGIQDTITMAGPGALTTVIGIDIPDLGSAAGWYLAAFDFSLGWDSTELTYGSRTIGKVSDQNDALISSLGCTTASGVVSFQCGWLTQDAPFKTGQYNLLTINWNAYNPVSDSFFDVFTELKPGNAMIAGQFTVDEDGMWAMGDSQLLQANMQGGKVNVVPEPVSTTLFIVGGLVIGVRRLLREVNED